MQRAPLQPKDPRIAMGQVASQLLEHFKTSEPCRSIVDIVNVCIKIFIELLDLEIVVATVVGVQLNPVVPVQLANAHGNMIGTVSHRSVQLRIR